MPTMRAAAVAAATGALLLAACSFPAASAAVAAAAADNASVSPAKGERSVFGWWDVMQHGSPSELRALLNPHWWVRYVASEFEAEPAHVAIEVVCFLIIAYLLIRKPAPVVHEVLSKKEEEELIAEWKPQPLCPLVPESTKTRFIVESVSNRTVRANGATYLNFASNNFLGLADQPDIRAACRETIDKYGVGSCGPRGFYGTFDVHLAIETALAEFMGPGAEEVILYSDSIASISSVIPAFAKKGDVIVVDESASFGIQQGCLLSRSDIHYFKHDDLADLERVLTNLEAREKAARKHGRNAAAHRKFIVLEGVSSIDGSIANMPRVVELKNRFKYRLFMDDSLAFGVLGAHGRGTLEHHGLTVADVDALCASMDGVLASVGGFCVGNHQVVDHQRLSGAGYCFSAASPPYTSTASLLALEKLRANPRWPATLRVRATKVRRALASVHPRLVVLGSAASAESAVIHVALKGSAASASAAAIAADVAHMNAMSELLLSDGIVVCVPEFIPQDSAVRVASLRIVLSMVHTDADIERLIKAVTQAANKVLGK